MKNKETIGAGTSVGLISLGPPHSPLTSPVGPKRISPIGPTRSPLTCACPIARMATVSWHARPTCQCLFSVFPTRTPYVTVRTPHHACRRHRVPSRVVEILTEFPGRAFISEAASPYRQPDTAAT